VEGHWRAIAPCPLRGACRDPAPTRACEDAPMGRTVVLRLVIAWLSNCVALLVAAAVIPAIGYGKHAGTLLLAGLILGIVNFVIRPAIVLLTLPAVILSLGLMLLVINALMLWLTSRIVSGFTVGGFWSTVGGAAIVWLVNAALKRAQRSTRASSEYRWERR
jgi:putative membrane protein